jgi:hypothetical protein
VTLAPHSGIHIQHLTIGSEGAPLLVIDNVVADPDALVKLAVSKQFVAPTNYYPGIRAKAPLSYQQFILGELREPISRAFGLDPKSINFNACHFSLVTKSSGHLEPLQRIPHVDAGNGLASVHYLFKRNLGGTAFYRHRKTGFEYIDQERGSIYYPILEAELGGPAAPPNDYINGDTPLFTRIGEQEGLFNRMLVYRRNSLHSGNLTAEFVPDTNPLTGRLSINSFLA